MGVLAHYLEIEWDSAETARRIEASTYPIRLETADYKTLHAETSIFRNFAPWFGLQLSADLVDVTPATIDANGERHPWLPVRDPGGALWWIPATGWSKSANRHISEMHRSFGTYRIELGPHRQLIIDAIASELDRAHVQEYLDDFRDELVWLAIGRPSGAVGEVGGEHNRDLAEALQEFAEAAARVLERPMKDIREVSAPARASRLRPNADTFRAALRRPDSRTLPGRIAVESMDTPENRYLRGMVQHSLRLSDAIFRSSARHEGHLAARSAREKARAAEIIGIDRVEVDREVFDNQLSDIRLRINAISDWAPAAEPHDPGLRRYRFSVGKKLTSSGGNKEFFYQNLDRDPQYRSTDGYDFSVARLPDELHERVMEAKSVDKGLSLSIIGRATVESFKSPNGKTGRRAIFTHIAAVDAISPLLERRIATREIYKQEGWHRPITKKERQEYEAEANTALVRATRFDDRIRLGASTSAMVSAVQQSLGRQDDRWGGAFILPSSNFPMGMTFAQNPVYATALAAFHRIKTLEQSMGIGGDTLDRLGCINVLHASALYERWCLIKIVTVLVDDFGFIPQADWIEHVVKFSAPSGGPDDIGFRVHFHRESPSISAELDVEPVLANGRRPDFRLRFKVHNAAKRPSISATFAERQTGLVMDAKFRTRWRDGELPKKLAELVETKDYGQDGDRVFILHPAKGATSHRTSPLIWSKDCDYGHDHPTGHSKGSIQLSADPIFQGASTLNLRRLVALELQDVFPVPEFKRINSGEREVCLSNATVCITCGKAHDLDDVAQGWTGRDNPKWFYRCSGCGAETMRTHCFGCGTVLHKNGLQMTYHLTIADHVSNVVCHDCGANF